MKNSKNLEFDNEDLFVPEGKILDSFNKKSRSKLFYNLHKEKLEE